MSTHRFARPLTAAAAGIALSASTMVAVAAPAGAHVSPTSYGTTFTANATNTVYLRVPHGCADAASTNGEAARTSKVVVDIPAAVTSLKPQQKAGWTITRVKDGTGAVTQVTWTANTFEDSLPDYTFDDFGLRGKLNGVAGDTIGFTTRQECAWHDDGTDATADNLFEVWDGANTPTVTLVATANAVGGSVDLGNLKAASNTATTNITSLTTALGALTTRVSAAETGLQTASSKAGQALTTANQAANTAGQASASSSTERVRTNFLVDVINQLARRLPRR